MPSTVTLHYRGRKPYMERQGVILGNRLWQPGDTQVVSARAAAKLLRLLEFEQAGDAADAPSQKAVHLVQQGEMERAQMLRQQERTNSEIAVSVQMMDKDALEQLARTYGAELDKRRSLETLRHQVLTMVDARQ